MVLLVVDNSEEKLLVLSSRVVPHVIRQLPAVEFLVALLDVRQVYLLRQEQKNR